MIRKLSNGKVMLTKHDRHRISVSNRQSCSDKIIGHLERPNDTLIRTLSSLIIILILTSFECLSLLLILFFFFQVSVLSSIRLLFSFIALIFAGIEMRTGFYMRMYTVKQH